MSVETITGAGGTVNHPITALYGPRRITPGDAEWPAQLDQLEPPVTGLWITGTSNLRDALMKSMTITGARAAGELGVQVAAELGADLARQGWRIITGGAYGIDAAATRGALNHRTPVIIVAPCGLNQIIPAAHSALFAGVLAAGGLIVSEYSPDTFPTKETFWRRNQLIGVLSRGVVVVEAAFRSSSITVVEAAEAAGTPVFAVPGSIFSPLTAVPHKLIREGRATLVISATQIMESYSPTTEKGDGPWG